MNPIIPHTVNQIKIKFTQMLSRKVVDGVEVIMVKGVAVVVVAILFFADEVCPILLLFVVDSMALVVVETGTADVRVVFLQVSLRNFHSSSTKIS